jgi:alkylresorcinol/alkylpyrone synthase
MPTAALVSLATSVPPNVFLQKDVLAAAWDELGPRFPEFATFSSIFANTGIVKRHGVKPFDWYLKPRGWPERTEAFLEGAEALFVDVARKALATAHLGGADIDTVVTVCSTGIATPSLEARVARAMGFRSDVMRVPVFGLGCAGGVSGLTNSQRPTSWPSACSATAPPRSSCAREMAVQLKSRMPASIFGPIRSGSWAGASIRKGLA